MVKADPLSLDLFALAVEPPKPVALLNRCKNGCVYPSNGKRGEARCVACGNPHVT